MKINPRKTLFLFILLTFISPQNMIADSKKESLADRLPLDKTLFYAEADLADLLSSTEDYLKFANPEKAEEMSSNAALLWRKIKEASKIHNFSPKLFDELWKSKIYFVVLKEFIATDKSNASSPQELNATTYLVIDSPNKVARDFINQVIRFIENHEDSQGKLGSWTDLNYEEGYVISLKKRLEPPIHIQTDLLDKVQVRFQEHKDSSFLGALNSYLVFSDRDPQALWPWLLAPSDTPYSQTSIYQKHRSDKTQSSVYGSIHLRELIKLFQSHVVSTEEKKKDVPQTGGMVVLDPSYYKFTPEQYQAFNNLLSLDKFDFMDFSFSFSVNEKSLKSHSDLNFYHQPGLSELCMAFLNGGRSLATPPGKYDSFSYFFRLDIGKIYQIIVNETLKHAGDQAFAQYQGSMSMMKGMVGYNLQEIINMLAGDFYFFFDIEPTDFQKKHPLSYDDFLGGKPKFDLLAGVKNGDQFSKALGQIFNSLVNAGMGQQLAKHSYQGKTIYFIAFQGNAGQKDLSQLPGIALTVISPYLKIGDWNSVTEFIRQAQTSEKGKNQALDQTVKDNPEANVLLYIPRQFSKKMEKLQMINTDHSFATIKPSSFDSEDAQLEKEIQDLLDKLVKGFIEIGIESQEKNHQPQVTIGQHRGTQYSIETSVRLEK